MNRIKKFGFIILILLTQSNIFCSTKSSKSDKSSQNNIDPIDPTKKIILDSIITPEMQFFIWQAVEPTLNFAINNQNKKTLYQNELYNDYKNDIIVYIISSPADNNIKKEALHAALEAVRIAKFKAAIDAAYETPTYLFFAPNISSTFLVPAINSELMDALNQKETDIKTELENITGYNPFNILWSWIPQRISNLLFTNQYNYQRKQSIDFQNYISYSDTQMAQIIRANDYKQKLNSKEAANLLWKQCLVAQNNYFDLYQKTNPPTSYIYDALCDIDEYCHRIITNRNTISTFKHDELLATRKAVQTALFMANKNSVFYLGYILPTLITQYLDGIIEQLMLYDKKLSILCKDPRYGATKDDIWVDTILTRISYAAAGIAITAAVATDYQYGFGTSAKWLYNGLFSDSKKITEAENNGDKTIQEKISPNKTPEEKFKEAEKNLEQAKIAERKIYEDEITKQKIELENITAIKKDANEKLKKQEEELKNINSNLEKISAKTSIDLTHAIESEDKFVYIINAEKVKIAQEQAEKKLDALNTKHFNDPKNNAALSREKSQIQLKITEYKNMLHELEQKEKIEHNIKANEMFLKNIEKTMLTTKQKLTAAEQEYSHKKSLFGYWQGSKIDLENLNQTTEEEKISPNQTTPQEQLEKALKTLEQSPIQAAKINDKIYLSGNWKSEKLSLDTKNQAEQKTMIQNIEKNLIEPIQEIVNSDTITKISTTFEQFKEKITPVSEQSYDLFKKAVHNVQQSTKTFTENKQEENKQYYEGLNHQEKKDKALWDALDTTDYTINPNATTYEKNPKNITTGLTQEENTKFAPYAAGALAAGTVPLAGAAMTGAISSIGITAGQGAAQGIQSFGRTTSTIPYNMQPVTATTSNSLAKKIGTTGAKTVVVQTAKEYVNSNSPTKT